MRICVLTVHVEDRYFSKLCHCEEAINLSEMLNEEHCSLDAAKRLVTNGDISFFGNGSSARLNGGNEGEPLIHSTFRELVDHAFSCNANNIVCFQESAWVSIPLLASDIELIPQSDCVDP